jgi:hypothetical protein
MSSIQQPDIATTPTAMMNLIFFVRVMINPFNVCILIIQTEFGYCKKNNTKKEPCIKYPRLLIKKSGKN